MAITDQKRRDQARRLRRSQTPAEARLWSGLRWRRLQNYKFSRQYSIGPFTVDFLCRDVYQRFDDVMDMIILALEGKLPEA